MISISKLKDFGANVNEGLDRCLNQEDFYLNLVTQSLNDNNFDLLVKSINDNDLDKAFEAAHSLKGVMGNLSLTPLYEKACEITELLRSRTKMDYSLLIEELISTKDKLQKICDED